MSLKFGLLAKILSQLLEIIAQKRLISLYFMNKIKVRKLKSEFPKLTIGNVKQRLVPETTFYHPTSAWQKIYFVLV